MRAADRDASSRSGRPWRSRAIGKRPLREMPDRPPPGGVAFREAGRSCGHSGHFASEVEFSKGYRYFASVIKLAKCGSAAKVGIRRVGIAVKTAHGARLPGPGARRPRGIAARTGPAPPPLSNETHWGRKPPIGVGNLPTPMPSCLPQCGEALAVAYPNAARHAAAPRARRSTAESALTRPSARRGCPRSLFQSDPLRDRRCNKSSAPTAPSRAPSPAPRRCRRRA